MRCLLWRFHENVSLNPLQPLCVHLLTKCKRMIRVKSQFPVVALNNFKWWYLKIMWGTTVYPKKYAHSFCVAVLCCGYTLTDFPISVRLTSLALWQSNDCPSASKATLMNMDKYFMWIHYERLHNHNKAKHNKTVCIFLGIYCNPSTHLKFSVETNWGYSAVRLVWHWSVPTTRTSLPNMKNQRKCCPS